MVGRSYHTPSVGIICLPPSELSRDWGSGMYRVASYLVPLPQVVQKAAWNRRKMCFPSDVETGPCTDPAEQKAATGLRSARHLTPLSSPISPSRWMGGERSSPSRTKPRGTLREKWIWPCHALPHSAQLLRQVQSSPRAFDSHRLW